MFDDICVDALLTILINSDSLTVARLIAASKRFYECYKENKEYIQSLVVTEKIDGYGIKTTWNSGVLHSALGNPAIVFPNGNKVWFNMGEVTKILYGGRFVVLSQDKLMGRDELKQQGYVFIESEGTTVIRRGDEEYNVRDVCDRRLTIDGDGCSMDYVKIGDNTTQFTYTSYNFDEDGMFVDSYTTEYFLHHKLSLDFAINHVLLGYDKFYSESSVVHSPSTWKIYGYEMFSK